MCHIKELRDISLNELFKANYVYDVGDEWDHSIRIERIGEAVPGTIYPRLLKASGACPPEDVGGAPGYEELLQALADPEHEQHDDMVRWS